MSLKFIERQFTDLSQITYKMYLATSLHHKYKTILRVKFSGIYPMGSAGNADAIFMEAVLTAAVIAWEANALLIDLVDLTYEWGDMLEHIFPNEDATYGKYQLPAVLVVGPACRKAVHTLVFGNDNAKTFDDVAWVYDDLQMAVDYIDGRLQ